MEEEVRCLILFPNSADEAFLSGGDYQLPLVNIQERIIQNVARTSDLELSSTQMLIEYPRPQVLRAMSIVNSSVSVDGRKRVLFFDAQGELVGNTGSERTNYWEDVYPRERSTSMARWRDFNFWSGKPVPADLADTTQSVLQVFDEELFVKSITVELDDQNNSRPFLDFGRLFISGQYEPARNYSLGGALQFDVRTTSARSVGGTLYHNRRKHPRVKTILFEHISESEAYAKIYEIQRRAGVDKEIFYIENPNDLINRQRTSFLARLRTLPAIVQSDIGRVEVAFEIEEII